MPRAHPTAIRHQILGLRSQGLSLVQIASQLLLPYSSVRRLCRRHRDDPARPLNPDYSRCGRRHTAATEALFQAACALKRNHPTWGAGIIRVQLSEQYPGQAILPRQERSSQTGNHGTTPPYGRGLPPARTRKGEVDSDSLFRVFWWIPWLISDPPGAAIGCCWTESAVRICADLGCRGNISRAVAATRSPRQRSSSRASGTAARPSAWSMNRCWVR